MPPPKSPETPSILVAEPDPLARALFENTAEAVLLVDPTSRLVVEANAAAIALFQRPTLAGISVDELTATGSGFVGRSIEFGTRHAVFVRPDVDEAPFRRIFQNNPGGVFRSTFDGRILECNDAFARMFGHADAASLKGASAHELYPRPADREAMTAELARAGKLMGQEFRMRRRDGTDIWVLENAYLIESNGERHIEGILFDITKRKRAESEFAREHALMRAVFESTPDILFYKGRDGRYRGCNRAFEFYTGLTEESLVGRTSAEVFPEIKDELESEDRKVYESRVPHRTERWLGKGTKRRLVETVITPLTDDAGQVLGLLGVGRDITDRRKSEEQLRQSSKMEAIGQLAGGVAHDFNNLLTIILGSLQLAQATLPIPHEARESLGDCEQAARRAAELTGQLLGFARRAPMSLIPTDVHRCVRSTITVLKRGLDPRIVVMVAPGRSVWLVDGAGPQLEQVLMNLLLNARDALPDGGRIVVSMENVEVTDADARRALDAKPGEYVRISVEDTGVGISKENMARIFEPFFTTKPVGQGTGLGLAMAYGIVKQHRGWIECQSEKGKGARFDIYLPRSASEPERKAKPEPAHPPQTATVMLVDDEPMIRNLGKITLERHGYKVLLAGDGQEAMAMYRNHREEISLVVLDLTMPLMTGQEVVREMRKIDPEVRVLFASGYSADSFSGGDMSGILGFLQKPYRPDELHAAVRAALERR